jgi:hypothetical protein
MRTLIFAASLLALALGAATLSGCASYGQGQQSLTGASMDWRRGNAVPTALVGEIVNKRR